MVGLGLHFPIPIHTVPLVHRGKVETAIACVGPIRLRQSRGKDPHGILLVCCCQDHWIPLFPMAPLCWNCLSGFFDENRTLGKSPWACTRSAPQKWRCGRRWAQLLSQCAPPAKRLLVCSFRADPSMGVDRVRSSSAACPGRENTQEIVASEEKLRYREVFFMALPLEHYGISVELRLRWAIMRGKEEEAKKLGIPSRGLGRFEPDPEKCTILCSVPEPLCAQFLINNHCFVQCTIFSARRDSIEGRESPRSSLARTTGVPGISSSNLP